MNNALGLSLMLGPLILIVVSAVAFKVFGPRRSAVVEPAAPMSAARMEVARSVAAGMLTPRDAPDDETLASVMSLKDQRKPANAVKLLRERTGLGLSEAKRLFDRL